MNGKLYIETYKGTRSRHNLYIELMLHGSESHEWSWSVDKSMSRVPSIYMKQISHPSMSHTYPSKPQLSTTASAAYPIENNFPLPNPQSLNLSLLS